MNTNHHYTTFVIYETCYSAIRRLKLRQFSVWCSSCNLTSMTGFPESALTIEHDIAEVIVIHLCIALQLFCLMGIYVHTKQTVSCRSYQQIALVLLSNIIDTRHTFRSLKFDMHELIVYIIVEIQTFLCPYPQITIGVNKKR